MIQQGTKQDNKQNAKYTQKILLILLVVCIALLGSIDCSNIRWDLVAPSKCKLDTIKSDSLLGQGTADDPFVICSVEHFNLIGTTTKGSNYGLDKDYILDNDIRFADDAAKIIGRGDCGSETAFTGTFEGLGYTISNIGFTKDKQVFIKNLFSCRGKVKDVHYSYAVTDAQVCSQINVSNLVTREDNATGPYIVCSGNHLAAINTTAPGLLTDSYVLYQDISLADNNTPASIGGACGSSNAPLPFSGSFDGLGYTISNIGFTDKKVRIKNLFGCQNANKVKNVKYVNLTNTQICSAIGTSGLGAREGSKTGPYIVCSGNHLAAINTTAPGLLTDSYVLYQDISLADNNTPASIGGACGSSNAFKGDFDGLGHTISNIGFTKNQTILVKNLFSCKNKVKNVNYAYLTYEKVCPQINASGLVTLTREGSTTGPYIVCSSAHLAVIDTDATTQAASYAMYNNINLAQGGNGGTSPNWTPLSGSFTGTFDGRGYKIQNLTISVSTNAGFFNQLGGSGTIQNLGLENVNIRTTGTGGTQRVGSLAATSDGNITNCYMTDSDNNDDVTGGNGDNEIGGLVGYQGGGSITSSYTAGDVNGGAGQDEIGGLVGEQNNGSITSSYATGDSNGGSGNDDVGGMVGQQHRGSITSSYATGNANGGGGHDNVGGLVGYQRGIISGNSPIITSSYATGGANGGVDNDNVGGLVGRQFHSNSYPVVRSSYATGNADGGAGSDTVDRLIGNNDGGFGTTQEQSYGFGMVISGEVLSKGFATSSTSITSAANLSAMNAGTTWSSVGTPAFNPWTFGSGTPPKLKYVDRYSSRNYICPSTSTSAFLPAIMITCGMTLIPNQP